jgi:hypothetical protein
MPMRAIFKANAPSTRTDLKNSHIRTKGYTGTQTPAPLQYFSCSTVTAHTRDYQPSYKCVQAGYSEKTFNVILPLCSLIGTHLTRQNNVVTQKNKVGIFTTIKTSYNERVY